MIKFLLKIGSLCSVLILLILGINCKAQDKKPNVIIVMTDDQGYGDLGSSGNDIIKTPNLDNFYKKSVRFTDFHVSPTCTPTRGALLTGRYTDRVGTWHTIAGRSLLFEDEEILPQVFAENSYATGMFGKWHLGDNYPFRPKDRGFQEVVRHGGGGITQGPDYWGNDYFDDTYWHNGELQKYKGYCTDVFFRESLKFIEENAKKDRPFFAYIATNVPHFPLHVPEKYYDIYKDEGQLLEGQKRFYGMITNIDDNFKRLEDKLKELNIEDNTILIFLTDNGTGSGYYVKDGKTYGFNAGMRGKKGSAYEGGHRVPFFIRWPDGNIKGGKDIDQLTAHIDILPTLLDLCNLDFVANKPLDGESLVPLLRGENPDWKNRTLFVDSQRFQNLVKWRRTAVMRNNWRLVNNNELYNIENDPGQTNDISSKFPEVVSALRAEYDSFWQSLVDEGVNERYAYIKVGSSYENPTRISAHDMHVNRFDRMWHQHGALLGARALGMFKIEFAGAGEYEISLRRYPRESGLAINQYVLGTEETVEISTPMPESKQINFNQAALYVGDFIEAKRIKQGDEEITFNVDMQKGKYDMKAILMDDQGKRYPAYYIYVDKR